MADTQNASWPAWYYGPKGASQIFKSEDEVPEGWADHPSKVGDAKQTAKKAETDEEKAKDAELAAAYNDHSDAQIAKELQDRGIEFGTKWPRTKLIALLVADDKKKA